MNASRLLDWYTGRDQREQRVLRWACVLAPALLLLAALLPLHRAVSSLEQRVASKQRDLAWMNAAVPLLAGGNGSLDAQQGLSVVAAVGQALAESGLPDATNGTTPIGSNAAKLQLDHASFNNLLVLSRNLADRHALRVEAAAIEALDGAGTVKATLTVRGP